MSKVAQVAEIAGVSTADVVRVATHGGTTRADWDIAYAIAQVTDQDPYRFMLTANRRAVVARIWADSREEETPAPTNPAAKHDPQVRIYEEPTAPDAPNTVLPDHPHEATDTDQAEDEADEVTQVEELAAQVYSDLDDLLRKTSRSTGRMVRAWTTTAQARREIHQVLRSQRRTRASHLDLAA